MVLALMMSYQCNFHCEHCMVDSSHTYSFVNDCVIEKFFQILEKNQPDKVYLVGGEVLLHIDQIESIVKRIKKYCDEIMIFSNGTFLLDPELSRRVENLDVIIRISDDRYHRKQWSAQLEERIYSSKYYVVKSDNGMLDYVIPVGRAYEQFKDCGRIPDCSLYTGIYDERYGNHHRCMIMMNGNVNLYCATIEASLGNVFEDDITYELLVKREKILHNYFLRHIMNKEENHYMAYLCNECPKYKVTAEHIWYENKIIADIREFEQKKNDNKPVFGKATFKNEDGFCISDDQK